MAEVLPEATIVLEEGGGQDIGMRHRWIVDPLDGTTK